MVKILWQILTWMETQNKSRMSAADNAVKLELTIKIRSLMEAEEYFNNMSRTVSQKAALLPLLRYYVKKRDTKKAEAFMMKINSLGLIVTPHPFNEMMKLYMATSQCQKVPSVIRIMKKNLVPRNVLTYNIWMNACAELSGVASAEMVYKEMMNDTNVEVGWSSLSTLANIYQKSGLVYKASLALRHAEKKLSDKNRLGYFFLITLYTSLNNKDGVLRLWKASKAVGGRITCTNYMCVLLSLVKLGDIEQAENIFTEWESQHKTYDIRVSNVLLGAYMRSGLVKKAEILHHQTLEKGGCPNYKTWEILMEGYIRSGNMEKAIDAMKKGFSMLKDCAWRPSPGIIVAIAEYFEKNGTFEDAKQYLKVIRHLGIPSLQVYKSLLRMYARNQSPPRALLNMMQKDGIHMDDETHALLQTVDISNNG